MTSRKTKGVNFERELVIKFRERNIAAIRVAGSGSTKYASPDIIAGKNGKIIAIECKSTMENTYYFPKPTMKELLEFTSQAGITPIFALRVPRDGWFFFTEYELEELNQTEKAYIIKKDTLLESRNFENFISTHF